MDPALALLRELVAIDSVNPSLVPGGAGEAALVAHLEAVCRKGGIDVRVAEVAPGRPNLVAVVQGHAPGRTLMFCGHADPVGVAGMASPFTPVEHDGRLYGRGAQDMKGGLAAMFGAALQVAASDGLERGRLVVAAVADEEYASLGADALVRDWQADAAVIPEPTGLQICTAHKGFAWIRVETRGVAAHGSRPDVGRDAIFRMGRVLAALEQRDRMLAANAADPRLGRASLHASTISGGGEWSTYPDGCVLELERRTVSGEDGAAALAEVHGVLAALKDADPEFLGSAMLAFSRPPYVLDPSAELPQLLDRVCRAAGIPTAFASMPFWTDAAILGGAGIPTVLFGPGGEGLHGHEEYVRLDEVVACRNALVALARAYC
jgi:acetylornithine deacetylase